jgi:hypothetical protein
MRLGKKQDELMARVYARVDLEGMAFDDAYQEEAWRDYFEAMQREYLEDLQREALGPREDLRKATGEGRKGGVCG